MREFERRLAAGGLLAWGDSEGNVASNELVPLSDGEGLFLDQATRQARSKVDETSRGEHFASRQNHDRSFGFRDGARVVCRRDSCGVYSLYYVFRVGKFFAFSSKIEPLLSLPGVGRRLNRLKAALYLSGPVYDAFDSSLTFFEGVFRLPAGHQLIATASQVKVDRYFSWPNDEALQGGSFEDLSAEFRERLRTAVRRRTKDAGLLLSGGLKSGAIAALARDPACTSARLPCWSFVPVDAPGWAWPDDPRSAIEALAREVPIEPHTVGWKEASALDEAADKQEARAQPRWFYIREDEEVAMAEAKRAGLSALLSGIGGQWLPIFRRPIGAGWGALRTGDWHALVFDEQGNRHRTAREFARLIKHEVLTPLLPSLVRRKLGLRPQALGFTEPSRPRLLLHDSFLAETRVIEWVQERALRLTRDFRENAYQEIMRGGLQLHLENWALLGRRHGLELRYPFLDADVVDFCFRLPARYYLGGDPQRVLREAMRGQLPDSIRLRERRLASIVDWPYRKVQLHALQRRRLAQLQQHPLLSALVNLAPIRAALDRFPDEVSLRNAVTTGGLEAAAQLVMPDGVPTTVERYWSFARFLDANEF